MVVCYALFYIATVFSLSYGVATLHIPRPQFLGMLCIAVVFMAAATPLSAWAGDRYGRRPVLLVAGIAALLSGFLMAPMLGSGSPVLITAFLSPRTIPDGRDLRADGRTAAGTVPDFSALYRRRRGLQSGRHSRRLAGALPRTATGVAWRPCLGGRLYLRRGGDQRIGCVRYCTRRAIRIWHEL